MPAIAIGTIILMTYLFSYFFFSGAENIEMYDRYFSHNELILSVLFAFVYWLGARVSVFRIKALVNLSPVVAYAYKCGIIPLGTAVCATFVWTGIEGKGERLLNPDPLLLVVLVTYLIVLADYRSFLFERIMQIRVSVGGTLRSKLIEVPATSYTFFGLVFIPLVPVFLIILD